MTNTRSWPLFAFVGWLSAGCGERVEPPAPPSVSTDKARLFGDPSLVPTREGERARAELARGGEIERALRVLPGVQDVGVDVELDERGELRGAVVVVRSSPRTLDEVEAATYRVVDAVLGPQGSAKTEVIVTSPATDDEDDGPAVPTVPLAMALLGLGVSIGITLERGRRVWARRRRRRSRRSS